MKIISIALLLISAFLSFRHGWDAFRPVKPEQAKMMTELGITKTMVPYFGALSIAIGLMLFFPQTFLLSNMLNAIIILIIMALSLSAGNVRMALIEIPFLAMPLVLIWLKHPFPYLLAHKG